MLKLIDVHVTYRKNGKGVHALRNIFFHLQHGEFVTITGPSGSGKTTFLEVCGGMLSPTGGKVVFQGREIQTFTDSELSGLRNESIGFVFQSYNLIEHLNALNNVGLPLVFRGVEPDERVNRALEMLRRFGLGERANHYPSELSGGECQRVAIARALITDPTLIIADEPTGNLDADSGKNVMDILSGIHREKKASVLLVTHSPLVAEYGTRQLKLKGGVIA